MGKSQIQASLVFSISRSLLIELPGILQNTKDLGVDFTMGLVNCLRGGRAEEKRKGERDIHVFYIRQFLFSVGGGGGETFFVENLFKT